MKALSIRQPWAWLIANGHKDIENRTSHTNFRGDFLIHASKKFEGKFGFLIKDAKSLPAIPCKGRLGFFEVEDV